MATQLQWITRALNMLGAVGNGQTPSPEDIALLQGLIPNLIEDLEARQIAYVADANDFPNGWLEWLATHLANYAAPDFGQAKSQDVSDLADRMLKAQQVNRFKRKPLQAQFY